jgi:hypothetical protein
VQQAEPQNIYGYALDGDMSAASSTAAVSQAGSSGEPQNDAIPTDPLAHAPPVEGDTELQEQLQLAMRASHTESAEAAAGPELRRKHGSAADILTELFTLMLLASGIAYGGLLLRGQLSGYHPPWPFDSDQTCRSDSVTAQGEIESVIGAAPIWMRTTLLSAIAARVVAKVTGFGTGQKKETEKKRKQNAPAAAAAGGDEGGDEGWETSKRLSNLVAKSRASSVGPALSSLLARDSLSASHMQELQKIEATLVERERFHKQELALAKNQGLGGLLRMLLTGHGMKPAPRSEAGWCAIAFDDTPQATWHEARESLGLTIRQAVAVSAAKLILWHWSQPMAFLYVFTTYSCRLSETQIYYGMVVSAREVLYLSTTLGGVVACPSYLLLDISTVWAEAETKWAAIARIAMYVLTPHNYAALCLATRFSERGFVRNPRHRRKVAALGYLTCCSAGPVFWLWAATTWQAPNDRTSNPFLLQSEWLRDAVDRFDESIGSDGSDGSDGRSSTDHTVSHVLLATAWWPLLFGLFMFVVIYRRKRSASSEVENLDLELQELGRDSVQAVSKLQQFQVHRGCWFYIESATPVAFRWSPGMDSAGVVKAEYNTAYGQDDLRNLRLTGNIPQEVTAAHGELIYALSDDPTDLDEPGSPQGWVRTEMQLWLPISVLAPVTQTIPAATLDRSRAHHRLKVKQQLPKHYAVRTALLEAQIKRRWHAQQERQNQGPLSHAFLALALVQVFADFCSCFALGELLELGTRVGSTGAPSALQWGYGITSSGFLLLFGPASVVALFRRAATPKWELEDGWSAKWGDKLNRAVAACVGCIMLVGLVYILVGAGLLAAGNDIYCTDYTGILKRTGPRHQAEWASTCTGYGKCAAGSCQVLPEELKALKDFKTSVQSFSTTALSTWTGDSPCAGWSGVFCSRPPRISVQRLDLGGVRLGTGNSTNVSTLAGLVHLTYLNLSNTRVVGDVGTLSPLTNLSALDVSGTSVTAQTPTAQVDALRAFKASMGHLDNTMTPGEEIERTWTGDRPCGQDIANDPTRIGGNYYEPPWYGITCNLVGKVPSGGSAGLYPLYGGSITRLKLTCGDTRCGLNGVDVKYNPCRGAKCECGSAAPSASVGVRECPSKMGKGCPAGEQCFGCAVNIIHSIGRAHHTFVTLSPIVHAAA